MFPIRCYVIVCGIIVQQLRGIEPQAMTAKEQGELEWQTRKGRIDPRLAALGWTILRWTPDINSNVPGCLAITEYPTANGPADYALFVDGQWLGIIEAKKLTLGPQNVLTQAERYSRGAVSSFDFHGFHVPFLYSTNGEVIWFHDVRHEFSRSRRIAEFNTPAALREMFERNLEAATETLPGMTAWHPFLRSYQVDACQAIEKGIGDRKRW